MKAQESLKDRIVERAFQLHRQSNRPPVMISCTFNNDTAYRARDVSLFTQKLVAALPDSLGKLSKWTPFESHEAGSDWVPGMMLIQGRAPCAYEPTEGRWDVSHGGSVYSSEPFVQAALDAKEKKLAQYRHPYPNCHDFWMLLIVEGFTESSFMTTPDPKHLFTSSFSRAFVYHLIQETATEVQLRQ